MVAGRTLCGNLTVQLESDSTLKPGPAASIFTCRKRTGVSSANFQHFHPSSPRPWGSFAGNRRQHGPIAQMLNSRTFRERGATRKLAACRDIMLDAPTPTREPAKDAWQCACPLLEVTDLPACNRALNLLNSKGALAIQRLLRLCLCLLPWHSPRSSSRRCQVRHCARSCFRKASSNEGTTA